MFQRVVSVLGMIVALSQSLNALQEAPAVNTLKEAVKAFEEAWESYEKALDEKGEFRSYPHFYDLLGKRIRALAACGEGAGPTLTACLKKKERMDQRVGMCYRNFHVMILQEIGANKLTSALPAVREIVGSHAVNSETLEAAIGAVAATGDKEAAPSLKAAWKNMIDRFPAGAVGARADWLIPRTLVALGERKYLEEELLGILKDDRRDAGQKSRAAFVAGLIGADDLSATGKEIITLLIEQVDANSHAQAALTGWTGQTLAGGGAWKSWWEANKEKPRKEWQSPRLTAEQRDDMADDIVEAIDTVVAVHPSIHEHPALQKRKEKLSAIKAYGLKEPVDRLIGLLENESSTKNGYEEGNDGMAVKDAGEVFVCENALAMLESVTGQSLGGFKFRKEGMGGAWGVEDKEGNKKLVNAWREWWKKERKTWGKEGGK